MYSLKALPASVGAEVVGIDAASPLSKEAGRALARCLYDRQLLLLRNQTVTPEQLVYFSSHFGSPHAHVLDYRRLPEYPAILPLSNIFKGGKPIHAYDGSTMWHVDQAYEEEPASATILYCIRAPDKGGETHIADMFGAYDSLPEEEKHKVGGLYVLHSYAGREAEKSLHVDNSDREYGRFRSKLKKQIPEVTHPVVRPHPVLGRKALFAVSGSARGIVGIDNEKAIALLDALTAHATQSQFVYTHKYSVGDLIIWDNASTMHCANIIPPARSNSDTRLMYRVSVKGYAQLTS